MIKIQCISTENSEKNSISRQRAASGAAVDAENTPLDPDLATVIEQWASLPKAIKSGILAMVGSAVEK
ncbi:hypothetical protein [Bythopirellula goksoeyrii]|uniref:Uncharacterized protein n=1 Tax=Bythopirellula goksoeyrii TaxID=1400387 RepID=A0A5B9Q927_9BACT|nr:hypothetical protein [Bythopirellula goksoeyrii]QEG33942.1 hypothetical protein Pr1d_12130 [Bythopirellula goksoeyrii]